jgi:histidinol-phosphate aminotransferase
MMSFEYERVVTPAGGLRLHLNENTAGCSPKVVDALQALTRTQAAFYPDYDEVIGACAAYLGVARDQLLLTNGLDEGILAASVAALRRAASDPQREAIVPVPAFYMYAACADVAGGGLIEVPAGVDFEFPLQSILDAVTSRTGIIFLTTPGNPTGKRIPREDILQIASAARGAVIFVDEAYYDFCGDTLIGSRDLLKLPNVVVGRTFAKAHGLAGLRIGALVGAPETLARLRRVVPPYSLNVCATVALSAALQDRGYHSWYVEQARTSRQLLYDALERLAVRHWQSDANFVLADFGEAAPRVVASLAARGVFVRDRSSDPRSRGCVRITAGVVEHTLAGIAALEEVLCAVES